MGMTREKPKMNYFNLKKSITDLYNQGTSVRQALEDTLPAPTGYDHEVSRALIESYQTALRWKNFIDRTRSMIREEVDKINVRLFQLTSSLNDDVGFSTRRLARIATINVRLTDKFVRLTDLTKFIKFITPLLLSVRTELFRARFSRLTVVTLLDYLSIDELIDIARNHDIEVNQLFESTKIPEEPPLNDSSSEETCPICTEVTGSDGCVTDCNHHYHPKCLKEWFMQSRHMSCPMCRHSVTGLKLFA